MNLQTLIIDLMLKGSSLLKRVREEFKHLSQGREELEARPLSSRLQGRCSLWHWEPVVQRCLLILGTSD